MRQGAADYLNLFTAQQQYQRILISYTRAKLQRYKVTAILFRALGGGWWNLNENNAPAVALAQPDANPRRVLHIRRFTHARG